MLAKLGSIDFGKWVLNTSSGFVVAVAAMFFIDSLVGGHRIESAFSDINAGTIVIFLLGAIVSSSILGLMLDSLFNAFGRWYGKKFWRPLQRELEFRHNVMTEIGLIYKDFEWMYAGCNDKLTAEIEQKYLRFTEVAGSTGYTMMIFFSPATFMFLRLEYNISYWFSMGVGIFVAFCGVILLLTSAHTLAKYEMKKTSLVLDDIRKLNARFRVDALAEKYEKIKRTKKEIFRGAGYLSVIIIISALVLLGMHCLSSWRITEVSKMTKLTLISEAVGGTADGNGIPTIEMVVEKGLATPGDWAASMVVMVNDKINEAKNFELKSPALSSLFDPVPEWKLSIRLFNTTGVAVGERIYINTHLSFINSSGNTIASNNITLGDWMFPVIVTAEGKDYLIAQVHVTIKSAPAENKETTGNTTATNGTDA